MEAAARLLSRHRISVAYKLATTPRTTLMLPKDPLGPDEKSNFVYGLECSKCLVQYAGETDKRLRTRVREHKSAIMRHETTSQVWRHSAESGHADKVRVTEMDWGKGGRLLREAWYTRLNSSNRCIELHPAYQALRQHFTYWGRITLNRSTTR